MFRMLQVALGGDGVTGGLSIARQLQVLFRDMVRCPPDLDVRPIGFVGPRERIGALPIVGITTPHALVLTWSHRSSLDP